jgi:hypothetical protein
MDILARMDILALIHAIDVMCCIRSLRLCERALPLLPDSSNPKPDALCDYAQMLLFQHLDSRFPIPDSSNLSPATRPLVASAPATSC